MLQLERKLKSKVILEAVLPLVKLLLVITANNASAILFSMQHIETFFKNTKTGNKLNNHVILHVHCRKIDQRNMIEEAKVSR